MKLIDIFRIALSTFRNNKMRTFLTIFGISIGIGAIVFLFSLGYGVQKITIGEITAIKALTTYNVSANQSSILQLNEEAVKKIGEVKGVQSVTKNLSLSGQVAFNDTKTDLLINAANFEFADLESPRIEAGKLFSSNDSGEIVITSSIAKAFNTSSDKILGQTLKLTAYLPDPEKNSKESMLIEKQYEVVGIIKDTSASYAFIPISSIKIPPGTSYSVLKAKVVDSKDMASVKEKLTEMGYQSTSVGEKVSQMNKIFNVAQIVLIILGAIALIVASIGMFNTLTISLLERTKDIGIMKALGATDKEIYLVFLTESSLISLAGGIFGIIQAFVIGTGINLLVATLAQRAGGEPAKIVQMPLFFTLIVLAFSFVVGIATGLYPSKRAAKLNPLDALRYE